MSYSTGETAKVSEVVYLMKKQYSLPSVIRGKPTIAFINEDLPHLNGPIKGIEVRSEADCRTRAPTRVLATSSTSSLGSTDSGPGDNSCPCISLSKDHVSPHHRWVRIDGSIVTPVAACFTTHSLAKSLICAEMTSMENLGSGLPREATNEDTSAPVRAKGRRINASCNTGAPDCWSYWLEVDSSWRGREQW